MKSHQHPSLSAPPSHPSPRAWAAASLPCCPQPAPVSPASPCCPSYLSRLCFFPVFFFFSLRMGEELSQLGGGRKVGALEGRSKGPPIPIPMAQGSPIPPPPGTPLPLDHPWDG